MPEPPTGQPALQLAAGPLDQEPGRPPGHPPAPALPVQPGAIGRPATAHDGGLDVQGLEAVCQAVVPRISAHAYAALRGELLASGVIHVAELSLDLPAAPIHAGAPLSVCAGGQPALAMALGTRCRCARPDEHARTFSNR